jgi:hypothetical protein
MKFSFKDLGKTIIGKGLPLLGGVIGGNAGESLGNTIAGVLGCDPDPASIETALQDEANIMALKQYEMDHKKDLQALALEESKALLFDRQNARSRELEITRVTGKRDITLYLLAWTVVIGFFALICVLIFQPLKGQSLGYVNQLFGALATGFGMVLSYFFGSSKGSADKNVLLKNVQQ